MAFGDQCANLVVEDIHVTFDQGGVDVEALLVDLVLDVVSGYAFTILEELLVVPFFVFLVQFVGDFFSFDFGDGAVHGERCFDLLADATDAVLVFFLGVVRQDEHLEVELPVVAVWDRAISAELAFVGGVTRSNKCMLERLGWVPPNFGRVGLRRNQ